jgi:hypothetical protein
VSRSGAGKAVALAVTALIAALAVLYVPRSPIVNADTAALLSGVGVADQCLHDGVLERCGKSGPHYSSVHPYPILQYIPALIAKRVGGHQQDAFLVLVWLNVLACVGMLFLTWRVLAKRGPPLVAAIALVVLLTGPFLWYSHNGWAEPLGAFLALLYAAALLTGARPALIGAAAFAAGLTKETAPLPLALIAVAILVTRDRRAARSQGLAAGIGLLAAVAAAALFDVFRYGSLLNIDELQPVLRMPWALRPQYFAGLLVSPTGGLLWIWPTALGVLVAAIAAGTRSRGRALLREPAPWLALVFVTLLAGFASWYSVFGADAWGPRLLLPWVPTLVVVALWFYGDRLARALRGGRAVAAAALACLIGLAQIGVVVDSSRYAHPWPGEQVARGEVVFRPYFPDASCPRFPLPTQDRGYYLHCLHHWTWQRGFQLVHAYPPLWRTDGPLYALVYVVAVGGVAAAALRRRTYSVVGSPA